MTLNFEKAFLNSEQNIKVDGSKLRAEPGRQKNSISGICRKTPFSAYSILRAVVVFCHVTCPVNAIIQVVLLGACGALE